MLSVKNTARRDGHTIQTTAYNSDCAQVHAYMALAVSKVTQGWPKAQGASTALTWPGLGINPLSPRVMTHGSLQERLLRTLAHCTTQRSYNEFLAMPETFQQDHPSHRMSVFTELFY